MTPKSASQEASNACIRVADRTGSLDADGARRALAALSEGRSGDPLPDRVALADPFNEPPWLWDESRRTFYRSRTRLCSPSLPNCTDRSFVPSTACFLPVPFCWQLQSNDRRS